MSDTLEKPTLDIADSAMGYRWELRETDERMVMAIAQAQGVPEIVARVLAGRGVLPETAEGFLSPTLRNMLPDPFHLLDMDKAVDRLVQAIANKETIAVFGDYDVDGATSTALLKRYFAALGCKVIHHIPDRMREGYGPNAPALLALQEQGAAVVITVDCGAAAHAPLAEAAEAGLDVIVVDHHIGDVKLPKAAAVVNPNRFDETSEHGHLAAVGVTFLLLVALNSQLRDTHSNLPDLKRLLDLVAIGTVCDVVPLKGVNRAFVAQGLKVLAGRQNMGLAALADVAGMDEAPGTYHLGFLLGPRINAGGRVGEADMGTRLLTTHDYGQAMPLAEQLDQFNKERKTLEAMALEEATEKAETREEPVLLVDGNWHPGVIGIVAGRLKDKLHKPVAVIAWEGDVGKASARSVSGVDFGSAVVAARVEGVLEAGGGHAMAAGFTVKREKLEEFRTFLNERLASGVQDYGATRALTLDGILALPAATPDLVKQIQAAGPFGMGNPNPRFAMMDVKVVQADRVGENHIRCAFTAGAAGGRLQGISFRNADTPLGEILQQAKQSGKPVHIAGQLR